VLERGAYGYGAPFLFWSTQTPMADDIRIRLEGEDVSLSDALERANQRIADLEARLEGVSGVSFQGPAEDLDRMGEAARGAADNIELIEGVADAAEASVEEVKTVFDELGVSTEDSEQALQDMQALLRDIDAGNIEAIERAAQKATGGFEEINGAIRSLRDDGTEASERIGNALREIATSAERVEGAVQPAKIALEQLGGSPAEFIGRTNNEVEKTIVLMADLQKQVDQLDEESREGLSGFADRAAKGRQRIAELREVVADLGDDEMPELRQELQRLEAQFEQTFQTGAQRAAKLEAEIENVEDDLRALKTEARGSRGEILDLTDALTSKFPAGAKAIFGAVSALAVFKTTFSETRSLIEGAKELGIIDLDRVAQETLALDRLSEVVIRVDNSLRDQAAQALDTQNKINILAARGYDVAGDSADKVDRIFAAVTEKMRLQGEESRALAGDIEALARAESGLSFEDLISELDSLQRISGDTQAEFRDLLRGPLGDELIEKVGQVSEALEAYGEDFEDIATPDQLRRLQEAREGFGLLEEAVEGARLAQQSWNEVQEEAKRIAQEQTAEAERQKAAVDALADSFAQNESALLEQAETLRGAFDKLRDSGRLTEEVASAMQEALAELRAEFEKSGVDIPKDLEDIEKGLAAVGATAKDSLNEAKEALRDLGQEVKDQADDIADAISDAARDSQRQRFGASFDPRATEEARTELEALRQELEAIEAQERQSGTTTNEAIERGLDLRRNIRLLESQIRNERLGASEEIIAQNNQQVETQRLVNGLVQESRLRVQELREQYPELSTAATTTLDLMISNLQLSNDIGLQNAATTREWGAQFETEINKVAQQSPTAFGEFKKGAESSSTSAKGLAVQVDETSRTITNLGDTAETATRKAKEGFEGAEGSLDTYNSTAQQANDLTGQLITNLSQAVDLARQLNTSLD